MDGWIESILTFVRENRDWAFWIALVFAIGENLAFLSIIIPSTAILMGVGALVATGELTMLPIFLGAAIGAIIGSFLSYFIGWRYGPAMLGVWPLRNHPDQVERGNAAFLRWGPIAVLIGHFFGPLRAVVFVMAGISRIPLWIFGPVNVVGCIGWAYLTPLVGEGVGHGIGKVWTLIS
ncbi:MAG: DedA family protein [Rhodobacterales bacterium]|nr:DedA family protein [Rhodobacterales bacterium]